MNRITRMLTMTGLGVFAAVSVGAGPAMAATGGTQTSAKPASPDAKAKPGAPSRTRIVDIYPSGGSCRFAGRLGELNGDWDGYVCYRTGGGYVLQVSFDSWGDWNNWDASDWDGPWGLHGHGDNFRGHGGGHRGHDGGRGHGGRDRGGRGHGGRDHGGRSHGGRGDNGVGAVPGRPSQIPGIGTTSPS
jgi:hypothetical protein